MKPTDLLVVKGTGRDQEHFVAMRTTEMPKVGRVGRDEPGRWKTSALKQYPPDFCRALARLFDLAQPVPSSAAMLPERFETSTQKLVAAYNLEAHMGPTIVQRRPGMQTDLIWCQLDAKRVTGTAVGNRKGQKIEFLFLIAACY